MSLPKNIKAVIFDFDGLMVDSEPIWKKTHDEFIEKNKISLDQKYKESFRGIGLKQLIIKLRQEFNLKKSVNQLLSEYRDNFYKNFFASSKAKDLIEGVEEVVAEFYKKGFKLAVATGGHTKEGVEDMLKGFDLLSYFKVIVSGDDLAHGKPHPDIFILTAGKLNVHPSECLVLEDSVNGVKAGKNAGMLVIAINKTPKVYDDLQKAGADEVFHSLKELL